MKAQTWSSSQKVTTKFLTLLNAVSRHLPRTLKAWCQQHAMLKRLWKPIPMYTDKHTEGEHFIHWHGPSVTQYSPRRFYFIKIDLCWLVSSLKGLLHYMTTKMPDSWLPTAHKARTVISVLKNAAASGRIQNAPGLQTATRLRNNEWNPWVWLKRVHWSCIVC